MELSAKQIQKNWNTFRQIVNTEFPTRKDALNRMYDALEEDERIQMAPAASIEYFHNAFPGGYVEHVLRVYEFSIVTFELWQKMGMIVNNFTLEELQFAALHHDLGKVGLPGLGNEHYVQNPSDWHRKNQGKIYQSNPNNPHMTTADMTVYLFNHYQIPYSINEMLGIKLTDGMFADENKYYLAGFNLETKPRTNIQYILHHADIMAYRFEFERWAKEGDKFLFANQRTNVPKIEAQKDEKRVVDPIKDFDDFFK